MRRACTVLLLVSVAPWFAGCGDDKRGESTEGAMTAEVTRCESLCGADVDCRLGGQDLGFRCRDGLCAYPPCSTDAHCVAELSNWRRPCAQGSECAAEEACIDVGGGDGRCALAPGSFMCAEFGLVEVVRPTLGGGAGRTVCGNPEARCVRGECEAPCASDDACAPAMGHPHCDPATRACVCASDQECVAAGVPGYAACTRGRCGCRADADCEGGTNVDACYAGACGCSADRACTTPVFDHATLACR
jgi:hypothetical protein